MTRYALIISCEEYKDFDNIEFCHGDAFLLFDTLKNYCDYTDKGITLLTSYIDSDESEPDYTYDHLENIVNTANSEDTILFYFAGHGEVISGDGYLLLPNSKRSDITKTSLNLNKITYILKQAKCATFKILDACHSGVSSRGSNPKFFIENIKDKHYATLASCSENEYSYPDSTLEQGIFTYSVAESIKNWALDEEIFLENLKTEVCKNVHVWCQKNYIQQTPTLNGSIVGNVSFARRNNKMYEYSTYPSLFLTQEAKIMEKNPLTIYDDYKSTPALWQSNKGIQLPKVGTAETILQYNCQLREREIKAIGLNYQAGIFELTSEAIWNRSIAVLRKRVLALGLQFVSEMVGVDNLEYIKELPAFEVINLAMELGFIDTTGKMRLMHANEIVQHYLQREIDEEMPQVECESVIRPCVQYVLGYEDSEIQVDYCDFREFLKHTSIEYDTAKISMLENSPYFYQRTTIRTLINLIATTEGAEFEIVSSNFISIVKIVWDSLTSDDKYYIGLTFSKYKNAGKAQYIKVFYNSLSQVGGFDYVPENLRSLSFIEAAKAVKSVHHGMNNFYNEPSAIKKLDKMGARIPKPAMKEVVGATLMILLGNAYGRSFDAVENATNILNKLSKDDWIYYIENCLIYDEDVLNKISAGDIRTERWCSISSDFNLQNLEYKNSKITSFLKYSSSMDRKNTKASAYSFLIKLESK